MPIFFLFLALTSLNSTFILGLSRLCRASPAVKLSKCTPYPCKCVTFQPLLPLFYLTGCSPNLKVDQLLSYDLKRWREEECQSWKVVKVLLALKRAVYKSGQKRSNPHPSILSIAKKRLV